jgi:hypothetical protein
MEELLAYFGLAFFPVTLTLAALWLSARGRAEKAEATIREIALETTRRSARPLREPEDVHRALDAIADEVERIAEGQRFTTRLLSEGRTDRAAGRVITPH